MNDPNETSPPVKRIAPLSADHKCSPDICDYEEMRIAGGGSVMVCMGQRRRDTHRDEYEPPEVYR